MASRNPQTMAKRAREQAVTERRERKSPSKDLYDHLSSLYLNDVVAHPTITWPVILGWIEQ